MSERNATASWSGFSHQGLVGLYVALKNIQVVNASDYEKYFINYEKKEDFAIYILDEQNNKDYKSIHQVKAYSRRGYLLSKYQEVFTGKAKKDDNGNFTGEYIHGDWISSSDNYLHTITEVNDWNDAKFTELSITNNFNIALYNYPEGKKYCDSVHIETLLKNELKNILCCHNAVSPDRIDLAYLKIVANLDSKIRYEHKTKQSKLEYDIKISFSELNTLIHNEEILINNTIFDNRKYFYNVFKTYIENPEISIDETRSQSLSDMVEEIYNLSDQEFLAFLKILNLDFEHDSGLSSSLIGLSNPHGLKQVFFWCLFSIVDTAPKYNSIDGHRVYYELDQLKYILSTIMEDDGAIAIKNILKNMSNVNLIWDNCKIINKELNVNFKDYQERILSISSSKERIMDINFSNSLISRENAKLELNNGE